VRENTGFPFVLDPGLSEIMEPTGEELDVLRQEIDSGGLLRH
jgi:hypothetical protein